MFLLLILMFQDVQTIGSVVTEKKLVGADSTIEVAKFADPGIPGITIYYSYPEAGGFGFGDSPSKFSIATRQTGKIDMAKVKALPQQQEIKTQKAGLFFKNFRVVRMIDGKTVVYLIYSKKLISGSPNSSLSAVHLGSNL